MMSDKQKAKERLDALTAMHTLIMDMNNENAYMNWIYLVPDEATKEDLEDVANDEEFFADVVKCFKRLWNTYIEDGGLFIGDKVY